MTPETPIDPRLILSQLGLHDIQQVEAVQGGSDTAIWRVETSTATYALRLFRPNEDARCEREIAAMVAARSNEVVVPVIHKRGEWQGRPLLLLSWLAGQPLGVYLQKHPLKVMQLGRSMGKIQAQLHSQPAPRSFPADDWIGWAGNEESALQDRLRALPSRRSALLHLDYHPLNVMTDGKRITGVLDWANARAGDPRADFARTYTILRVEPYVPDAEPLFLTTARRMLERAWRGGYMKIARTLPDMPLFYAWAGAAMLRDLAPRVGKPESWFQERHLDQIREWTTYWKRQAGL